MKINTLLHKNAELPKLLAAIYDPPKQLHVAGSIPDNTYFLAVVGSRRSTQYGSEVVQNIIAELAGYPITIVSGLAFGIDALAHRAALAARLHTIAVLPSGLRSIYPVTNHTLAQKIIGSGGALVSEYPHNARPFKHYFLERNRIIAGLCHATLVVEAAERSGALATASHALNESRELMCIPGNITSAQSVGTNKLIQNGAHLIMQASDILSIFGISEKQKVPTQYIPANDCERAIVSALLSGPLFIDALQAKSQLAPNIFNQTVTLLEISGAIRHMGGGNYTLT